MTASEFLAAYVEDDGIDGDPSIGLTREAWCYVVPAIAIDLAPSRDDPR